ncbi:hypothetical protein J1N35_019788 [Gossypium stocksii]|uniref:Uncharacterized protein n=1 Tax=Gossypium stocksii TaxID=47602 RepID=A0A9D3VD38_9ROSI|nr:hypothetical protein J1N35_019788 [Gossypium stocksii]
MEWTLRRQRESKEHAVAKICVDFSIVNESVRPKNVCYFILVLIISQEIAVYDSVEGRALKSEWCNKCSTQPHQTVGTRQHQLTLTSKAQDVDGVRPTEPGHSPGVGHYIKN